MRSLSRDVRIVETWEPDDDQAPPTTARRPTAPRKPMSPTSAKLARQVDNATLPAEAKRVCLVSGRERSEPYVQTANGEWIGTVSGKLIDPEKLRRAFAVGLLAILPSIESAPAPVRPAPAPVARKAVAKAAPVVVKAEPTDAGEFIPPSDADRAEWSRVSLQNAPVGTFFIIGERRQFAPARRRSGRSTMPRQWHEYRAADLDEIRPAGQPFDSPEWEMYYSTARVIEACYN